MNLGRLGKSNNITWTGSLLVRGTVRGRIGSAVHLPITGTFNCSFKYTIILFILPYHDQPQ